MKKIIFQTVFACGVLLSLVNCSKDSGGGNSNTGVAANGVCTAGSVYTSQGCLAVGQCAYMGASYGWNGTQCVGGGTGSVNGACGTGMVYSAQYGCLSQCGVNSGWMNNQCIDVGQQTQNCNDNTGYNNGYNSGYNNNYNNSGYNTGYSNCNNNGYNNGYYDRYYQQQQRPRVGAWYGFGVW